MNRFYSRLLHLYPPAYVREYGDEMRRVFRLTLEDARERGRGAELRFVLRELSGVLKGSFLARMSADPRAMGSPLPRPRFAWWIAPTMLVTLVGVLAAISKAQTFQLKYGEGETPSPLFLGLALVLLLLPGLGALGYLGVFAARRSGTHRLQETQTWTDQDRSQQ